jgi:RNA polymerase sigma factor (sigma-70 family)
MLQQSERLPVRPLAGARDVDPLCPADPEFVPVVRDAAAGDRIALARLVAHFDQTLRGVVRSHRLSRWDADDVIQDTWLQFMLHGRELREPAAVRGWLVTTARRMSFRMSQRRRREQLSEEPARGLAADRAEPDRVLLAAERRDLLHGALAGLPERQRNLVRLLMVSPDLSYEEVGELLAMPVGSIGPTRARSLDRLRHCSSLQALHAAGA